MLIFLAHRRFLVYTYIPWTVFLLNSNPEPSLIIRLKEKPLRDAKYRLRIPKAIYLLLLLSMFFHTVLRWSLEYQVL